MKLFLDTHILLNMNANKVSSSRLKLLQDTSNEIFISQISLWETTKLYTSNRIKFEKSLEHFILSTYHHPRFTFVDLNSDVLIKLALIIPKMHKDSADQIIVASAQTVGAHLMTDDRLIIKSGLVNII